MKKHIIVFVFTNSENEKQGLESLKYIRETKESILNTISKNTIVEPLIFSNNESFEEIVDKITEYEHRDRIVGFHFHGHANTALMWINDEKINARPFNEILKTLKSLKFAFFCGCQTKAQAEYLKKTDILTISTSNEVNEEYAKDISIEFYKHFIAEKNTFKDSFETSLNIILAKQNPGKDFHQAEALNDLKSDYGIAGKNTSLTFEELIDSDKDFVIYKNTYFRTNINEYKKYYSRNFHARKKELKFINQGFSVEVPEKILLSGGGGSGKTTLALEYIKQNTGAYSNILVIDANDIKGSLSKIIQNADIENIFDNLRFLLNKEKHNTLLFFDNFDNTKLKDDFANCFWYNENKPNIHVLVTSRLKKSTLKVFNDFSTIELEYFNEKEAVDFLYAQLPHIQKCEDGENSIAQAKILAKDILDGMPMAIEMTAGLIKSNNLSFNAIAIDYKNFNPQKQIESIETKEGLITKMDYVNDKDKGIIKYLWKRNIELLSTSAIELLQLSSFLYNRNIPVHDILHPAYSHLHKNTNKTEFYGILDSLKEYNLVKSDDNNEFISIHALLQEVILAGIQEEYEGKQVGFFEKLKFYLGLKNRRIKLLHYGLIFTKVFKQKYKNNYFVSFNDITRYGNNLISFVSDFRRVSPIKLKSVITKNYDTQTKILNFIDIYKVNRKGKVTTKYNNIILDMLSKAANNKMPDALYDSSLFIKEFSKKFEYLEYAAKVEHILAQYDLGMIYNNGNEHLDKNEEKAFYWVEKSAGKDFTDAQYQMGVFYSEGVFKDVDFKRAFDWYEKSANQGHVYAQFDLAHAYLDAEGVDEKDYSKAYSWMLKAANQGHAYAQYYIGKFYYDGIGVKESNKTLAVEYFKKSAEQGISEAKCELGFCYLDGIGIEQDYTKALTFLGKSAREECLKAQLGLGLAYYVGDKEIAPNYENALIWLSKAANRNCAKSQYYLARYFSDGKGDYKKAIFWHKKAAINGNADSQYELGIIHSYFNHKYKIEIDRIMGISWLRKAALQGHVDAQTSLGLLYLSDYTIKYTKPMIKYTFSSLWLRIAVKKEHPVAIRSLAINYAFGYGSNLDIDIATRLCEKANRIENKFRNENGQELDIFEKIGKSIHMINHQGFVEMLNNYRNIVRIGKKYLIGNKIPKDYDVAFRWFSFAFLLLKGKCNERFDSAKSEILYYLGLCNEKGFGTTPNNKIAFYYYRQSSGFKRASVNLQTYHALGRCYENGLGTSVDLRKAFQWYRFSAMYGGAEAGYDVGRFYEYGIGTDEDLQEAYKWYMQATRANHPESQYKIALSLTNLPYSFDINAIDWLLRAYNRSQNATKLFNQIHEEKIFNQIEIRGSKNEILKVVRIFRDIRFHIRTIRVDYKDIDIIDKGFEFGKMYLEKLIENNYPEAYFMLGKMYFYGSGIHNTINNERQDKVKALQLIHKAAELGDEESKLFLEKHSQDEPTSNTPNIIYHIVPSKNKPDNKE